MRPRAALAGALLLALAVPASGEGRRLGRRFLRRDLDPETIKTMTMSRAAATQSLNFNRLRLTRLGDGEDEEPTLRGGIKPARQQCENILPADWKPCGHPDIKKCQCAALGCCWGKDNPFASELVAGAWQGTPSCYYKYGGGHAVTPQQWSMSRNKTKTLSVPVDMEGFGQGEAEAVSFLVIPADRVCGTAPLADAVDKLKVSVGPQGFTIDVEISEKGTYKVCMNDSRAGMGSDEEDYFTVDVGVISVFCSYNADVASNNPGGCPPA